MNSNNIDRLTVAYEESVLYNDPLVEMIMQEDEYGFIAWLKLGEDIMTIEQYNHSLEIVKNVLIKYEKFEWIKFCH
jgi:hypothetical protein